MRGGHSAPGLALCRQGKAPGGGHGQICRAFEPHEGVGNPSLRFKRSIINSPSKTLSLNCLLAAIFLKTVFRWQLLP